MRRVSTDAIGVGVIGASPLNPGWAVAAHLPAIAAIPDYELRAVSTSRRESAEAASTAFGVPGFDDHREMIAHPGVDLVVVTVKVPHHHELVSAALAARKMVLCEWPLGNGLTEAIDLEVRGRAAGVRTAIGLQGRFAPAIRRARDLIAEGAIGDVLATTLVGSGLAWGPVTDRGHAYMFDQTNGATTLSVPTLHALDALCFMLGEFDSVGAGLVLRRPEVEIVEDRSRRAVTSPDQIAIIGALRSGAAVSVFYRGGSSRGVNLRWEINGSDGDLVLTSSNGNIQVADLRLEFGRGTEATVVEVAIPSGDSSGPPGVPEGPASNVGRLYTQLAKDIREGTSVVPDFAHAVKRHRLLNAIETASRSGMAQTADS
jgi:predicted dehydrogenase